MRNIPKYYATDELIGGTGGLQFDIRGERLPPGNYYYRTEEGGSAAKRIPETRTKNRNINEAAGKSPRSEAGGNLQTTAGQPWGASGRHFGAMPRNGDMQMRRNNA